MRKLFPAILLAIGLSSAASTTHGYSLSDLFGCPDDYRGCCCHCGSETGCACESDCACEPGCDSACGCEVECACEVECGCEVDCACDPACGCGSECCVDGRQFAGKRYTCECDSELPWCPCTGPECCNTRECGTPCCGDPACGCGTGCGDCCEPCGPTRHQCCLKHCGFCAPWYVIVNTLCGCGNSGCGCDSEVYWSEWHNDPPRCCDPCDVYGNWIGPSAGSYRAPYDHPYSPQPNGAAEVYARGTPAATRPHVARQQPQRQARTQTARTPINSSANKIQW